ncbi:uncharacterized protein LOC116010768 [Ipomoea triloba]|uniref:uncharacterized protein LOC116010768 n=1 Tax=Ipomoea triloba TaxID=35885 RepID=UPI00125E53AA|nr:uncharacterized protein LOC116010768 [Ipomoea triloba]
MINSSSTPSPATFAVASPEMRPQMSPATKPSLAADECWVRMTSFINPDGYFSFTDWVQDNIKVITRDDLSLLVMLCWNLCLCRNEKSLNPFERLEDITESDRTNRPPQVNVTVKWKKLKTGWSKLNVDAAIDANSGRMGFGWILRDDNGHFKAARCTPWNGVFSPKEAEAVAIREALSWIKSSRLDHVILETDALTVVQCLNSNLGESSFDLIVLDIKDRLSWFSNVFISFIKRSAN